MRNYESLSAELSARMAEESAQGTYTSFAFDDQNAIRRRADVRDEPSVWRPVFARDTDKILYCPYYNRYTDKTQVFSLFRNDDLTRRSLHVQLVSRIARTIGAALHLNLDLIEAISLGHDIGHTPFAHSGERILDAIYAEHTGRRFSHNIHSVRVLDSIYSYNCTLQTLDGIACHNGELELDEYRPAPLSGFDEFDAKIEDCYRDITANDRLIPSTLEGCVVRISDIIAYIGKDRQDAVRAKLVSEDDLPRDTIGGSVPEIINNLEVNIIENSYGKPYIRMDREHYDAFRALKRDNYEMIYKNPVAKEYVERLVEPMMRQIYDRLLSDLVHGNRTSPIYTHHIAYVRRARGEGAISYEESDYNALVVDYIASMTDDYFNDLYRHLFPSGKYDLRYHGYFD